MPRIVVTLACGCQVKVDENAAPADRVDPVCDQHKERRVARVHAPAPRFRGASSGPLSVKE
jgi:hypothetical protein